MIQTRSAVTLKSGIRNLAILKTTGSAFKGHIKDAYTTLKETDDRILATNAEISWLFSKAAADFDSCYFGIRRALLESFARHDSMSVQHTLYAMAQKSR